MTAGRIFFLVIAVAAAIGALVLLGFAHQDMAEMRTVRPTFNFDGIVAFVCSVLIAGGLVVLFPLWRFLAYNPDLARRDLAVWIGALAALLLNLHLPFAVSLSIDTWINATAIETSGKALEELWLSGEGLFLLFLLLWPLPAIVGLWKYKDSFAPHAFNPE